MNRTRCSRPVVISAACLCSFFIGCEQVEAPKITAKSVSIEIIHEPLLSGYLNTMATKFRASNPKLADKTNVRITLVPEHGMTAAQNIASGLKKAAGWIAPSASLVKYANSIRKNLGATQSNCVQLFGTPYVLAARKDDVEKLHLTDQTGAWSEIFNDEKGAQRATLSMPPPDTSSTGLGALAQVSYISDKSGAKKVTAATLNDQSFQTGLKAFHQFVSSYDSRGTMLLRQISMSEARFIRLGLTTEQQLATYNQQRGTAPLVSAIYPKEGSYWEEYSYCISESDWNVGAQRAAAELFLQFLKTPDAQYAAKTIGFRPSIESGPEMAPLTKSFGVNTSLPTASFPAVEADAVPALLEIWPKIRRPQAAILILDTSGTMEGEAIRVAQDKYRTILAKLHPGDKASLITFSTLAIVRGDLSSDIAGVAQKLDGIESGGGSAMYDAFRLTFSMITHEDLTEYRKTVLVITDGDDKNSDISLHLLLNLAKNAAEHHDINLIIYAINNAGSPFSDLKEIAAAVDGTFEEGPTSKLYEQFEELGD